MNASPESFAAKGNGASKGAKPGSQRIIEYQLI
jgi:hypothetical protein